MSAWKGKRKVSGRVANQTFLIVCEGEKTEPLYFKGFNLRSADVRGAGKNTRSVVEEAIRIKNEDGDRYEQVWCVFDRDSFPAGTFNTALQMATAAGIQVAYTNEAFELWYLLHYSYSDTALSRRLYPEKLTKCLGRKYQKNDRTMHETLRDFQKEAIARAKTLLASYGAGHNPEKDNPSTRVHVLVELLRDAAAKQQ